MDNRRFSTSEFAIASLEDLSDQISNVVLSKTNVSRLTSVHLTNEDQETLRTSFLQMRSLLDEAQVQFTKMAENNRHLAAKIDGSLHETNEEMHTMKAELQRLTSLTKSPDVNEENTSPKQFMELEELKRENKRLLEELAKTRSELRQAEELNQRLTNNNDTTAEQNQLKLEVIRLRRELNSSQEQIHAMKVDQKKQKAEKLDLLGQMRQIYGTLEDKENELKNFISIYEHRITESENMIKQMNLEKTDYEQYRLEILQRVNSMTERGAALKQEVDFKDQIIAELEHEIAQLRRLPKELSTSSSVKESLSDDSLRSKTFTVGPLSSSSADYLSPVPDDNDDEYYQTFPRSAARMESEKMNRKVSWSIIKENGCDRNHGNGSEATVTKTEVQTTDSANANGNLTPEITGGCQSVAISDEEKIRILTESRKIQPVCWKANHVRAWLELDIQMPCYGAACAENIKGGRVLLTMTDSELDSSLGIQSPIHRRKLRLAIEELRHPEAKRSYAPSASSLTCTWVASDWLPTLGLPQFSSTFEAQFVDGRLLSILTKKDLEKHFSVLRKLHQSSILCGIELLRKLEFDKQVLMERRAKAKETNTDLVVWTNEDIINWIKSIDMAEYSGNLKNSGIHGALLVLDQNFNADTFAEELGIPPSKILVMRHISTELKALISNATAVSVQPKKANASRSPFIRSFRGGRAPATPEDQSRQSRSSEKSFSLRGSIGRAFGKKLNKDQIRVIHTDLNTAKSLSNIDESSRQQNLSPPTDQNDRLI